MSRHVVIAGASGLLGRSLTGELGRRGHRVTRLVRRTAGVGESRWDPYTSSVDGDLVSGADVVVNLAGSPLIGNPHLRRWARDVRGSRVTTTEVPLHLRRARLQRIGIETNGEYCKSLLKTRYADAVR